MITTADPAKQRKVLANIAAVLADESIDSDPELVERDGDVYVQYQPQGGVHSEIDMEIRAGAGESSNTVWSRTHARTVAGLLMTHGYDVTFNAHGHVFICEGVRVFFVDKTLGSLHESEIKSHRVDIQCGNGTKNFSITIMNSGDPSRRASLKQVDADGSDLLLEDVEPEAVLERLRAEGCPLSQSLQMFLATCCVTL